jgi:hypothetical protein
MAMTYTQKVTCCPACASGLKCDDQHGLIQGPWAVECDDGKVVFLNRKQWAAVTGLCCYCRGPLPRGRQKRLLNEVAPVPAA